MQHHVERSHCRSQWHCSVHRDESLAVPPGPHTSMARLARDLTLEEKNEENMQNCNFMQHEAIQRFTLKLTEDFHCAVITRMPEVVLCNNSSTMVQLCSSGVWTKPTPYCNLFAFPAVGKVRKRMPELIQIHPSTSKNSQTHTYKTIKNYSCKQYLNILLLESDTCLSALVQHISTLEPT